MKKILALIAVSVVAAGAHAENNTINFQGEVASQTCSINVNGTEGDVTVLLETANADNLAATASSTGAKTFTINLTGCTASTTAATYSTKFIGNNVDTSGNLGNTGTATNVAIQVLEPDAATAIDFSSTYTGSDLTLAANATTASATYTAQYYSAAGSATAGTVVASLQYAVSYL